MRYAHVLLTLTLAAAACGNAVSSATPDTADSVAETQRSSAVLFVERQAGGSSGQASHVGARFVQYAGLSADALPDLLGTPHLPSATVGCVERSDATVDSEAGHPEARLLDVGTIEVRSGDQALQLEPRRFPDLWNVVSGVIYATDGDLPADSWHFSAPGNSASHMAAFEIDARSPDDLAGLTVADQAFAPGSSVTLPHHGFSLRWTRGDHDDGIIATFEAGGATDRATTIACTAHDDGALDVDASWAERIADLSTSGSVITIHRIRSRPFTQAQVDSALVVFDLSVRGHGE